MACDRTTQQSPFKWPVGGTSHGDTSTSRSVRRTVFVAAEDSTAAEDTPGPEDAASVPAGFLYNGALSTYETLGFTRDRKIGKHRWVVTKVIEPSS